MEHRDTLLTIAELAVALAGFATIASVFSQRDIDANGNRDGYRLRVMLEVALRNAGFAVLPLPFLSAFPDEPDLWRIGSGVYVVVAMAYGAARLPKIREVGPGWVVRYSRFMLAATAIVSLANVFGLAGPHTFSLYLATLLFGLSVAGVSFMAVAYSALGLLEE